MPGMLQKHWNITSSRGHADFECDKVSGSSLSLVLFESASTAERQVGERSQHGKCALCTVGAPRPLSKIHRPVK